MDTPAALLDLRHRLTGHPVYRAVRDPRSLGVFMEHHVVCVLDFMSLVKRLQVELTCTTTPWTPPADRALARFVNEIVLDEESDAAFGPEPASHYEWYLAAMDEVGADSGPIRRVEERLRRGVPPREAVEGSGLPPAAEAFARTTFELCAGPLHVAAAAFFHGREEVIPAMFLPLVRELERSGLACGLFRRYLERHIEVDGEAHGPLAERLLRRVVAGQPDRQREAEDAALRALRARGALWDAVFAAVGEQETALAASS